MNGAVRRRGLMDGDDGIFIEHPERITIGITTTTDNISIEFGYFFNFYVSTIELDGTSIGSINSNCKVTIIETGSHIITIYLRDVPQYNSANYYFAPQVISGAIVNYTIFPHYFGTKYGKNKTYSLALFDGNKQYGEVYLTDSVPFASSSSGNNWTNRATAVYIPKGSLQTYIDAGYPVNKLKEVKYKYKV